MLPKVSKLAVLISLVTLFGCSAASGGGRSLAVNPGTVAFGQQLVNTVSQQTLTITNTGTGALQIQKISLDSSSGFGLSSSSVGVVLQPGRSLGVSVSFKPSVATSYNGTVEVISKTTSAKVLLTGTGTLSAVGVLISPTGAAVQVGHSQQFTATVSNTSNTAVTWLVNGTVGGDSTLGTISSSGLYTAPSSIPSPSSVTVTAQSVADTSKSASANVNISAPPPVSVSISPTGAAVQVGHSQQFTATVSNTSNTAVTWLVNGTVGGDSTLGTISSSGLYTAPSSIPSPSSVAVTAQSVADTSKSASASVSVVSSSVSQYYVAPTGSDSNDGSATHPWATIAHSATVIGPGATVHAAAGTYTGYFTTSASGTSSSRITYISDAQWSAKIVGDLVDRSTWHNYGDYVDIVGFELTSVGRMGLYNDGSFVRYIGNHVHDIAGPTSATCDLGGAGIMHGNYSASDDEMIANFVHDIGLVNSAQCPGYVTVHGLYHANLRGRIVDNLVIHARDYGIHLYHYATDVIVANNTSLENGASGLVVGNSGGGSDNNTIVTNNIFAHNHNYGFRDDSGTTGPNNKYDNNLTFNNGNGDYVASGGTVSGNISSDPRFVNYTGTALGDYHPQATSPAIDSGTTLNAPSIDLDGGDRPIGSGYDIGCYEYGTTHGTWPWY
jgi:hypothetical protein